MNKTLVFITFSILVALALVGTLTVLFIAPEQFSAFTGFIIVLLGVAATFATTASALERNKQEVRNLKTETSTKLDVVQRQTNGTLTRLIESIEEKDELIRRKDRHIADLEASLLNRPKKGSIEND